MALAAAATAHAAPVEPIAPVVAPTGRWPVTDPTAARAMLSRLVGHRVGWRDQVLMIDDIAGAGRPWIGVVARQGDALVLTGPGFAWPLRGPLARPRLAGPGYLVWVTGKLVDGALVARRLGVLAPPAR